MTPGQNKENLIAWKKRGRCEYGRPVSGKVRLEQVEQCMERALPGSGYCASHKPEMLRRARGTGR